MEGNFYDLTGKILIATPYKMSGNVFYKSMVYIVQHFHYGSIGLIFNKPASSMPPGDDLIKKINSELTLPEINLDLHIGGPCNLERGFFMHSLDYKKEPIFECQKSSIGISSNADIIQDINNDAGPKKAIFIIGYTGWHAGQLEVELENNLWIVSEPNSELIFSENHSLKWDFGLADVGINVHEFAPQFGNC